MRMTQQFWLLFACFLFTASTSFAKKGDKVPGYIIDNDGERIEGTVQMGSITDNEVKVQFIHQGKSRKTTYKPNQLQGYGMQVEEIDEIGRKNKRWIHFERQKVDYPPKPFGPTTVFMEKESEGDLTLYCYYIEVRNNPKKPYKYHYYIKDTKGKFNKITRDKFTKDARSIFKDYTALSKRIGSKKFEYRNLDRMVRDYNYWTVAKHDANEYKVAMKDY
ncbi:MAG: hypothetical protein AAFV95_04980 [Bacteroidota bacterium]